MSTTGYAYASGQGFHVKLTRMNNVVPLRIIYVLQTLFELVLFRYSGKEAFPFNLCFSKTLHSSV
ncbi:MAG: hypothetical protein RMY34_25540 [Aulosira sp. DedQUE10]|nr:hypothetical protein [Aulosira sp. DedQUE10]